MESYSPDRPARSAFSKTDIWLLIAITLFGAIIRVLYLYNRSYTGDEIGTLNYMEHTISYLLSHFTTWLTMNYFIVLEKLIAGLFGKKLLILGFIPLVAGIAIIPLTAILSLQFTSSRSALAAAGLVSMNPYLIQYSAIIRSYSLLAALSVTAIILFFKWRESPSYKNGIAVAVALYFLNIAHPNGIYTVIYVLFMSAIPLLKTHEKNKDFKNSFTLLIPLSMSCILVFISYYRIFPDMMIDNLKWHETPPAGISYVPHAFREFTSGGFLGWLSAFLFVSGVAVSYKYDKKVSALLPAIFLPIIAMSAQGLSHFPWGYARFLIFTVPVIMILITTGCDHIVSKLFSGRAALATSLIMILLILSWLPRLAYVFDEKYSYPWNKVALFLKEQASGQDIVVGSDWTEPFHIKPYYQGEQDRLRSLEEVLVLNDRPSADSPGKMFYVTYSYQPSQLAFPTLPESHFISTAQPVYYFGKIQVVVYSASSENSVLQKMRGDLIDTVQEGKALAPEFASKYKNIMDINNRLGLDDKQLCYYNLWTKCSEMTERLKNIPRSLRLWQTRQSLNGCK